MDSNPYKFCVYRSSAQNTGNNAFSKVQFNTETFDTNSNYDNATNYRYTIPVTGFYYFNANAQSSVSAANFITSIYVDGAETKRGRFNAATATGCGAQISAMMSLTAAQYVEVYTLTTSAVALDVSAVQTYFEGFLISRT